MQKSGGAKSAPAPTGCFKCGRPGHWSRDCPSSTNANQNPKPNSNSNPNFSSSNPSSSKPAAAPKKVLRTRPKLTPDLLLSDDGLGYVLRHFPKAFKYHGRGHEANDLGNLIGLYAQWHSRLIPYYSFEQFVRKVEKVGTAKRVKRCISELKARVSRGEDPTKLHEPPTEQPASESELGPFDEPILDAVDTSLEGQDVQEEMFDEIFQKATEETDQCLQQESHKASEQTTSADNAHHQAVQPSPNHHAAKSPPLPNKVQLTEEQRARIEANRLKALERAAARACSLQTS